MCGIVGAVSKRQVADFLIDGLKKLEYRGYDSAGIAIIDKDDELQRLRVTGKVRLLEDEMKKHALRGNTGIAHTRWATHGAPSTKNAHPFISHDEFALVHNGIIENHITIRDSLIGKGYQFYSETDTEVVVHLIHQNFMAYHDLLVAVRKTVESLEGAYAFGIISKHYPDRIIAVRQGSPLVIGLGKHENYIASDPLALLSVTKKFIYLEDNDIADITLDQINIFNEHQERIKRDEHTFNLTNDAIDRGEYRHYMQKEIMEQPKAIESCIEGRLLKNKISSAIFGPKAENIFPKIRHVQLIACGTSFHAALVARYWIESLTGIPCNVEVASEFRYRGVAHPKHSLFVTLSQSGETADTLAALRLAKKLDYLSTLAIGNVPGSTMLREADSHFLTRAGAEIGVASTKAFVTQLTALLILALALPHKRQTNDVIEAEVISQLHMLPELVSAVLDQDLCTREWAETFTHKQNALFIARGALYPIALEGALKMKEISYIHAEGYPAGELKHGPLALVDPHMPVIAIAPGNALIEKTLSNLQEVRARGGKLYILTDSPSIFKDHSFTDANILHMPKSHPLLHPILYTVPLQLLAYHVAVLKGTDVDQPRNLAKSVTVE